MQIHKLSSSIDIKKYLKNLIPTYRTDFFGHVTPNQFIFKTGLTALLGTLNIEGPVEKYFLPIAVSHILRSNH